MKPRRNPKRTAALSWLEVLVIIATLLLVLTVWRQMFSARPRAHSINCVNNLKQVALAARMWSNDHGDKFPWAASTNQGGTREYAESPDVFRHFEIMSNELSSPKILVCPKDSERLRARSFVPGLANSNLSYFVGLEANEIQPQSILSGDRHIGGGVTVGPLLVFRSNSVPSWDAIIHTNQGNVALGDGSVQQLTEANLSRQFQQAFATQTGMTTMRLAIPRVPGETSPRTAPVWVIHVSIPVAGAAVTALVLFGGWLWIRRRYLVPPGPPSTSDPMNSNRP